jgi:hypothetical protein
MYSGFSPCHGNIPQLIEAAKRDVQLHGGLCIDISAVSLHESFASKTSIFLRNLVNMDDACAMIGLCSTTAGWIDAGRLDPEAFCLNSRCLRRFSTPSNQV